MFYAILVALITPDATTKLAPSAYAPKTNKLPYVALDITATPDEDTCKLEHL